MLSRYLGELLLGEVEILLRADDDGSGTRAVTVVQP